MIEFKANLTAVDLDSGTLKFSFDRSNATELNKYLGKCLDGAKNGNFALKVAVKDNKPMRSLSANAYFHTLVNKLARFHNLSDEEMKRELVCSYGTLATDKDGQTVYVCLPESVNMKQIYAYSNAISWKTNEKGTNVVIYQIYKQTHELDSKEFAKLLDGVVQECKSANENGAEIDYLTPEEQAKLEFYEGSL